MKDTREYYIEYLRREWYVKRDKSKMAALVPCDPTKLKDIEWKHKLARKFRFSASTSDIFGQHNPAVVLRGAAEDLMRLESRAAAERDRMRSTIVEREACPNVGCKLCPPAPEKSDMADCMIAVTYEQLFTLIEHVKRKRYAEAWELMVACGMGSRERSGQRIIVDGRLTLVRAHWLKGGKSMLVSVLFCDGETKLNCVGGKRDPALTTDENVGRGGESTEEAAVRETKEETGIDISIPQLVHIPGQRTQVMRRTCLRFFWIDVSPSS